MPDHSCTDCCTDKLSDTRRSVSSVLWRACRIGRSSVCMLRRQLRDPTLGIWPPRFSVKFANATAAVKQKRDTRHRDTHTDTMQTTRGRGGSGEERESSEDTQHLDARQLPRAHEGTQTPLLRKNRLHFPATSGKPRTSRRRSCCGSRIGPAPTCPRGPWHPGKLKREGGRVIHKTILSHACPLPSPLHLDPLVDAAPHIRQYNTKSSSLATRPGCRPWAEAGIEIQTATWTETQA